MNEQAGVQKRSIRIAGHATSVSLEPPFWEMLGQIAARRRQPLGALVAAIDAERSGNLSSAIRVFVLDSCRRGELADRDPSQPCTAGDAPASSAAANARGN